MATDGNGGLGSSEEVREGQLMGPTLESVDASLMEDSTQNRCPWLKPKIDGLVREAFEHFWKSGLESVATFLKEGSTQNTSTTWLDSKIHTLVREEFEHFMKSGTESDAAFLKEGSTQNTSTTWLDSKSRTLVHEAFEHFLKLGPASCGFADCILTCSSVNRREQIQERYGRILRLRFQTSMPCHFFVGENVEGRDFCVKLIDATTGTDDVVASGDLSFMTLDVVVLESDFDKEDHQDWTWEHFECKLAQSREGKGPLLKGDLQVCLDRGVGSLGEFKFTDISTCRRSGKFRLGVKVASGFHQGIRVLEAITAPFEVKHFKKKSKAKHIPCPLDNDVCTLMGIGKDGAFHKNLNYAGISKVKDFLWKLGLDPKGLRKIVGRTMSEKKWKTLGEHAKKSIPCGKYHVYYADYTKNSGVVFKNMSELCGLIEDGKYYSAETLSDSKKVLAGNLKKGACAKWNDIVEYDGLPPLKISDNKMVLADNLKKEACANWKDIRENDGLLPLEMNPRKRPRFSQTDVVTFASEYCPSDIDLASSSCVGPPVNPGQDIGAPVPCQPPSVPSGEASKSSMPDSEGAGLFDDMLDDSWDLSLLCWDAADVNSVCSSCSAGL